MSSYIGANAQGIIASIDGGTIRNATLDSSVVSDDYGYAQVNLTADVGTQGFITFNTIVGDSNFTISNELITLPYSGIYHIIFSASGSISTNTPERNFQSAIYTGGGSLLAMSKDQVSYLDASTSFANGTSSYVGSFSSSDTVKFYFKSDSDADIRLDSRTHVSIILIRRTA